MRIVHVIGHFMPGLGYEENCLPHQQARMGNEVILFSSNRLPPDFRVLGMHHPGDRRTVDKGNPNGTPGVEVVYLPSTPDISGNTLLFGLRKKLSERFPDVVHAHGALAPSTIQCLFAQRRLGFSLIVDDHSHPQNFRTDTPLRKAYFRGVIAAYARLGRSVAAFVPVTPAARVFLETQLRIPFSRIHEGALGADPIAFAPSPGDRATCRAELGLSSDDLLVLTTGKFSTEKNLESLLHSFESISRRHDRVKLILAGTGQPGYVNRLNRVVETLALGNKVTIRGLIPHNELARFYNAADIGVWPGVPSITVLEAMSAGLPCILPIDDLAYERLVHSGACEGFKKGEIESLTESIEKLVTHPELRTTLSVKGRALVEERLSWRCIALDLMDVYERGMAK